MVTDPKVIANTFNSFFASVADKIRSKIPKTPKTFSHYLKNSNPNTIFLSPTTKDEVLKCISSFNQNKASGPYSFPPRIMSLVKDVISEPISELINLSFLTGSYPDNLKVAKVIPIHKKETKLLCNNYRPISLLSNLDKMKS